MSSAQLRRDCAGSYQDSIGEDSHSVYFGDADSDVERRVTPLRLKAMVMLSRSLQGMVHLSFLCYFLIIRGSLCYKGRCLVSFFSIR